MSDHKREIQELDQRKRGLEAQLENENRETRLLSQETKYLQGATEEMRDLMEKIKAQQPGVRDGAGKSSGDSDGDTQGRVQK